MNVTAAAGMLAGPNAHRPLVQPGALRRFDGVGGAIMTSAGSCSAT